MDTKKKTDDKKKRAPSVDEVVRVETVGLYPSNEMDDGMIPRSKATSRAGIDAEGESHTRSK